MPEKVGYDLVTKKCTMKSFKKKLLPDDAADKHRIHINVPSVQDYMVKDPITFKEDTEILHVVDTFLENCITGAPVVDGEGNLKGLIDDKDCLKVLIDYAYFPSEPGDSTQVKDYMTNVMKTISPDKDILEVAATFFETKYKRLVVVDAHNKVVGQISRRDILRAIRDLGDEEIREMEK